MRISVIVRIVASLILIPSFMMDARGETATEVEMEHVCQNWLAYMIHQTGQWDGEVAPRILDVQGLFSGDTLLARCFSIHPRGHIVVPVLKELPPVKAYSDKTDIDVSSTRGYVQLLREVLANRQRLFVKAYGSLEARQPQDGATLFDRANRDEWERFLVEPVQFRLDLNAGALAAMTEVPPLLSTCWHQEYPYNELCPEGDLSCTDCCPWNPYVCDPSSPTVVGCVATAAAQIMRYWSWPPSGTGSHEYTWAGDQSCDGTASPMVLSADFSDPYDWANMPPDCDGGCSQAERDALSELCYEIGVAFEMDYGVCGSGVPLSHLSSVMSAYPAFFRYDSSIDREDRSDYANPEDWFAIIQEEINSGRPMQYFIWRHSIVCDGWRDTGGQNQYHMNYGWGGDCADSWFAIDNLYCPWEPGDVCPPDAELLFRNIMPSGEGISISSITPNWGITGTVHITNLAGTGFEEGATVKLTHTANPDINGINVVVVSSRKITCDLDLTGANKGRWDVVVTNPGGDVAELVNGFLIGRATDGGEYPSIAIGSDGTVHVAHMKDWASVTGRSSYIYHTSIGESGWSTDEVCTVSEHSYLHTWMGLGSSDQPHLGYSEGWDYGEIIHRQKNGSWSSESVDGGSSPNTCGFQGMAMAVSGNTVHYVYEKQRDAGYSDGLCYRVKTGGSWSSVTWLETDGFDGALAVLADHGGNLHVAYTLNDDIVYRKRSGDSWGAREVVHADVGTWYHGRAGIALDSQGNVHITYAGDNLGNKPYYARKVAGTWSVVGPIDNNANCDGGWCRLCWSPENTLHAAYYDDITEKLKYAVYDDGSWTITELANQDAYCGPDIALDDGRVHIVYGYDEELHYLWFPTYEQLTITTIPEEGGTTTPPPGVYSYLHGEFVTVTAEPYTGWLFDAWSGDGTGTDPVLVVPMDAEKIVVATFSPKVVESDTTDVAVPENGTAEFRVRLAARPPTEVGVSVFRDSGDPDITVQSGSILTFSPSDWNIWKSVTLAAGEDEDEVHGIALIKCCANGWTCAEVIASEIDNDRHIWYVDWQNTAGPWDGSPEHPFQHVQDALAACSDGHTIRIRIGDYREIVTFNMELIVEAENGLVRIGSW